MQAVYQLDHLAMDEINLIQNQAATLCTYFF